MPEDTAEWRTTTDHDRIREWATVRDAVPTANERTDERLELRLEAEDHARGERLSWERFFELFESEGLAFQYRTRVSREQVNEDYELLPRQGDEPTEAESSQTHGAENETLATSDTGDSEPPVFDRVESEQSDADDANEEPTTPMSESAQGSVDAGAIVLDEIHETAVGPGDWQGSEEYVVLENDSEAPVDLSGWTVENEVGQSYQFDEGTTLRPGEQLTLHSGEGADTDEDRYWNADEAVWGNQGDTVLVKTPEGDRVVTETYKGGR